MAGDDRGRKKELDSSFAIPISLILPLLLAVAGGGLILLTGDSLPVPAFYNLAAQVIPLLMIAFALEGRAAEFLSDPQMRIYRAQLFLFLLGGEIFALLGASGALRGGFRPQVAFEHGVVAGTVGWSNVLAAGTAAGLVGGFSMLTVLALFWGPGWVFLSFRKSEPPDDVIEQLRQQVQALEAKLDDKGAGS